MLQTLLSKINIIIIFPNFPILTIFQLLCWAIYLVSGINFQ